MNEDQNKIANQEQTENILRRIGGSDKLQTESIVKRILTSEIKWIIFIVIFLFGIIKPYFDIRTDIELIKQNHLAHIENIEKNIEKLQEEQNKMKDTEVKLMTTIAERLPAVK